MAYLGMCTMDLVEYVHAITGDQIFASSSCPPDGYVRANQQPPGEVVVVEGTGPKPIHIERMTPQQIERAIQSEQPQADNTGLLYLLALGALALYA